MLPPIALTVPLSNKRSLASIVGNSFLEFNSNNPLPPNIINPGPSFLPEMTVLLDISLLFPFDTICISLSDGKTMLMLSPVLKFTFVNVNVFVVEFQLHPSSLFSSS